MSTYMDFTFSQRRVWKLTIRQHLLRENTSTKTFVNLNFDLKSLMCLITGDKSMKLYQLQTQPSLNYTICYFSEIHGHVMEMIMN